MKLITKLLGGLFVATIALSAAAAIKVTWAASNGDPNSSFMGITAYNEDDGVSLVPYDEEDLQETGQRIADIFPAPHKIAKLEITYFYAGSCNGYNCHHYPKYKHLHNLSSDAKITCSTWWKSKDLNGINCQVVKH